MTHSLISKIYPVMDNSVQEYATEDRKGSYWGLDPVFSGALHMEPLSKILAFSVTTRNRFSQIYNEMDNLVDGYSTEKK